MVFSEFAEYLEKLEATSSRVEMTKILAELFDKATPEDARLIAYMTQGKLGPAYNTPDFGVAEKQALKAIVRVADGNAEDLFKRTGDLGITIEQLKLSASAKSMGGQVYSKLQIAKVHEKLMDIAKAGGAGSQEEKISLLAELLTGLDARSAKYAVKIVLGKLRTGFSSMTVLDALSWMMAGDKSLRNLIEQIYNVRADLGDVARLIKLQFTNSNKQKISKSQFPKISVDPVIGTPVLTAQAEREKSPEEIWERVKPDAAAEHKLDGLRIEAHVKKSQNSKSKSQIFLFSRGLENVTNMYPDIVEGLEKQINVDCILDGEMIAVGQDGNYLPFQETVQRKRKHDIEEMRKTVPLKYYCFDCLYWDKTNMIGKTNTERRERLEKIIQQGETVRLMPRKTVHSPEDIELFFRDALARGTEGTVVKKMDSNYQSGARNFNWIKYKKSYAKSSLADTIDAVVMGYDAGQGKRSDFGIGDFLIGVYDSATDKYLTIAKIGTGLTDDEWRSVKAKCDSLKTAEKPKNFEVTKMMDADVWCKPKIVVEIMADEITKSPMHSAGLALRFPRLISFREKEAENATNLKELEKLYSLQKK